METACATVNPLTSMLVCLLSIAFGATWWLIALLLVAFVCSTIQALGIVLTTWTAAFAFIISMPLGGALDLMFSKALRHWLRRSL